MTSETSPQAVQPAAVIDPLCMLLIRNYVFPESAAAMAASLRERAASGVYDEASLPSDLAARLTEDLQAVSHDKHLRVFWNRPHPAQMIDDSDPKQSWLIRGQSTNFGFQRVERLPGNVGYLDLRGFYPAEYGGEVAVAAMNFLARTDALLVDIRKNGGGAPSGIALLTSYLFPPAPVHLNDLYLRSDDSTHQWWTLPWVPGTRYLDKPVWVLTSSYTFSAAEEFAYNLQSQGRATLVGETTGGGAHPGGIHELADHFEVFIPDGRAINPITGTNWEGTGVVPEVAVSADEAQGIAYRQALEYVIAHFESDAGRRDGDLVKEAREALQGVNV